MRWGFVEGNMWWQRGKWRSFHRLRFYTKFGKLGTGYLTFRDGKSQMHWLVCVVFFKKNSSSAAH